MNKSALRGALLLLTLSSLYDYLYIGGSHANFENNCFRALFWVFRQAVHHVARERRAEQSSAPGNFHRYLRVALSVRSGQNVPAADWIRSLRIKTNLFKRERPSGRSFTRISYLNF